MGDDAQPLEPADDPEAPRADADRAGEGRNMRTLAIGVVAVLLILGTAGLLIGLTGTAETAVRASTRRPSPEKHDEETTDSSLLDPSNWTYFGRFLGRLNTRERGVSGNVYAADEHFLCLTDFNFDGKDPPADFIGGSTDEPDKAGKQLYAHRPGRKRKQTYCCQQPEWLHPPPLQKYTKARVVFESVYHKVSEYKYLSVYSGDAGKSYADLKNPAFFKSPETHVLGDFYEPKHGVKSVQSELLDSKRMKIKGFHFDGDPETYFSVGKGDIKRENAMKIRNTPVGKYGGKDVLLTLPADKSWNLYEWFSVYSFRTGADFGHIMLPAAEEHTEPVYEVVVRREQKSAHLKNLRLKS